VDGNIFAITKSFYDSILYTIFTKWMVLLLRKHLFPFIVIFCWPQLYKPWTIHTPHKATNPFF
jgi:hypothetical protein